MAATTTRTQGKSAFVKEVLFDNPLANAKAVNEAWKAAGMEGTISESLVKVMRSELGLAGNLRGGSRKPSTKGTTAAPKTTKTKKATRGVKKRAAKTQTKTARVAPSQALKPRSTDRNRVLTELEGGIDSLIFKLMAVGGPDRIVDALRTARRLVVRSHMA